VSSEVDIYKAHAHTIDVHANTDGSFASLDTEPQQDNIMFSVD